MSLIPVIVGYTLVGALVFTVVATCASLVGWIKFANKKQQNKLFHVLLVQLCVIAVGFFARLLKFDVKRAANKIQIQGVDTFLGDLPPAQRTNLVIPQSNDSTSYKIRSWLKEVPQNKDIVRNWLDQHGMSNTSIALLLDAELYRDARSRLVSDLNLQ